MAEIKVPEFGSPDMRKLFYLGENGSDKDYIFINHGSFGATPKVVMQKRFELLEEIESNPDRWFRRSKIHRELETVAMLVDKVGGSVQDIVLMDSTTTGINTVLKSLKLRPDDIIIATNHSYGATVKAATDAANRTDSDILIIDLPKPIRNEDQIVAQFEEAAIRYKGSVQLAIVDHITSVSGIKMPVTKIANKLRAHGILVLVDGAHGPGQVEDLDVAAMGVDFYAASLHKWLFTPKGCGFLWVNPVHQRFIHPLITSHTFEMPFPDEFHQRGTRDETTFALALEGMKFHTALGGAKGISDYVTPLLDWAVGMFCSALDVKPYNLPATMIAPCLRCVECPKWMKRFATNQEHADELVQKMATENGLCICITWFNAKPWIRFSGNVYNNKQDYIRAKDVLLKMRDDIAVPS